jgi:hypothetical protein
MDLFGPTTYRSIGGNTYCLVIVDGYSRFTCVFFLHDKAITCDIFKLKDQIATREGGGVNRSR